MLLLIDNFDSFTDLIGSYFSILDQEFVILDHHQACVSHPIWEKVTGLLVGPGPKGPDEAGNSLACICFALERRIPFLGICLGHQCLVQLLGGKIIKAKKVMHGKVDTFSWNPSRLWKEGFSGQPFTRYHSLVADKQSLPKELSVVAFSKEDEIMAVEHQTLPAWGVQFHPESIQSTSGLKLLECFVGQLAEPKFQS